ncbi:PsiF family protein [soil metagenome]
MITLSSRILATTVASLMLAGSAFAQTATPATPATPATKMAPAKTAAPKEKTEHSAASLECSKQADAKGLHGKERKKFRSDCKKTAGKPN